MTVCSCVPLRPLQGCSLPCPNISQHCWTPSPQESAHKCHPGAVFKRIMVDVIWHGQVLHTWAKCQRIHFFSRTCNDNIHTKLPSCIYFFTYLTLTSIWLSPVKVNITACSWKDQQNYVLVGVGVYRHFLCICSFWGLHNCLRTHSLYLKIFGAVACRDKSTLRRNNGLSMMTAAVFDK